MAHFAQLDENNVVLQVIVVGDKETHDVNGIESEELGVAFCKRLFGLNTNWKQTSYNGNGRVRYAGIGFTYNTELDAFVPPAPYPSWTLNKTTADWQAPIQEPPLTDEQINDEYYYEWNEDLQTWELFQKPLANGQD